MTRRSGDADPTSQPAITLWRGARVVTLHGDSGWNPQDGQIIATQSDSILWMGPQSDLPKAISDRVQTEHELDGRLLLPGLIDCHTHLVYGGTRAGEFERRLAGESYESIARAGGGIRSTVDATRAADDELLVNLAVSRARQLMAGGATTIEIKSGYGLSFQHEARCLRAARQVGERLGIDVKLTCLAAHTVPAEYAGQADAYVEEVCRWLPELSDLQLVDAVDAFCDTVGFTLSQTQRVLSTACQLQLPIKLHAEQLSLQGGAEMASQLGALSCDHLEYLDEAGVRAMAKSGTVAVLLPGAYYYLQQTQKPPVPLLRSLGVPMAVATDHNPGSSPLLSLPLAANMACVLFGLTPREAIEGMTIHAARALGFQDRGTLTSGNRADFSIWELDHPREIVYWTGNRSCSEVVIRESRVQPSDGS